MLFYNGFQFYIKDYDFNMCVVRFKGGWWYINCYQVNFNGVYFKGSYLFFVDGIEWKIWYGFNYFFKFIEMKIR